MEKTFENWLVVSDIDGTLNNKIRKLPKIKALGLFTAAVVSALIFGMLRKQATILLYFLSSHPICRTDFPAISQ